PLRFGDNRLQVRLTNAWQTAATSEDVPVRWLRPPRDITIAEPKLEGRPLADLTATVVSPLPLLRDSIKVEINGRSLPTPEAPAQLPGTPNWTVLLKDIPLDIGANEVRLWVGNAEGQCRQPGVRKIVFQPPAPPPAPPQVVILDPAVDLNVTDPDLRWRFW